MSLTDPGVKAGDIGVVHLASEIAKRVVREQSLEWQALLAHRLGDGVLAVFDGVFTTFLREPLPDLGAGPWALDEHQPVAARAGVLRLGRENLRSEERRVGKEGRCRGLPYH